MPLNEFKCYEVRKGQQLLHGSWTQDTDGLSRQYSTTEPQQPDNHQEAFE